MAEIHRILKPSGTFVVATHLGEAEVYSNEFLGHDIETVGGTLYRDDELLSALDHQSFAVEEVHRRSPLPHEHDTERIYFDLPTSRRMTPRFDAHACPLPGGHAFEDSIPADWRERVTSTTARLSES